MQWLERTLLKKPPPPRSHRLRRGLTLKSKAKKNRGESWRELFYRTTAAAARWWWGATLFLCLSGKAIHAGGKPGCTHCSWLFQVQIRDDDQNSMATGFSLCLLFFWTEQKNCLRRKSRQGSAGHNKRWAKISEIQKKVSLNMASEASLIYIFWRDKT